MRTFRIILAAAILSGSACAFGQTQHNNLKVGPPVALPLPASKLLETAESQAQAQGKNVLVIFHASWCIWCKRLDAFMTDPNYKQVFDDNFVVVKVTVQEDPPHKALENPGGEDVMDALGGRKSGLPLFAILDPSGKMIINSVIPASGSDPGGNMGFPAKANEIDHFQTMMQKGAPKVTADQIEAMKSYLAAQEAAREAAAKKSGGH